MAIGLGLVFLAGLVSFLSPCVISLVPVYLGVLGSYGGKELGRISILMAGISFFVGFTVVFLTLGFTATVLGNLLYEIKPWIARVGGTVIFIFGLHLVGVINIPFLNYEWRVQVKKEYKNHFINAFLLGILFSAGWSPCIGPILGAILTGLTASHVSSLVGIGYLLVYSLGLGIPFILAAAGAQPLIRKVSQNKNALHILQVTSGIVLCITGVLLVLGVFSRLAQFSSIWLV